MTTDIIQPFQVQQIIATNLKRLREARYLSQEQLAHRLGKTTGRYISLIERCYRHIDVAEMLAIAQALKCDPDEIYTEQKFN